MNLVLLDVFNKVDHLVSETSGLSIFIQSYDDEDELVLEYDDGAVYKVLDPNTPVEVTDHKTVIILGTEYRAYEVKQIDFKE